MKLAVLSQIGTLLHLLLLLDLAVLSQIGTILRKMEDELVANGERIEPKNLNERNIQESNEIDFV